jgi:PIN domain nuclease of toxin-antitoxin system
LLLDTVAVVRWLDPSPPLSRRAQDAITTADDVRVSVVSLWELSIKQSIGKLTVRADLREHVARQSFVELPVLGEHTVAVRDLPLYHRDPFDRMLIAQARCEGLMIVTSDRAFAAYGVPILPA